MEKITNKTLVQIALIVGIIILLSLGINGWGWFMLLLVLSGINFE
jgi:hypothetical protein